MPRKAGQTIPKYRKHRGSGQAVVTIGGQDFYLGPYGTRASKLQYDRLIGEWLANGRHPLYPTSSRDILLGDLCLRYWRFAKQHYRKNGKCTRVAPGIKCALRYLKNWYGKTPAADFGPLALKAVRERMIEDGHSRRYINDHVDRIKRMFKWGVGEQLVPPATYESLRSVVGLRRGRTEARETDPILPIDDGIVEKTLDHLPWVVAEMVRLQRCTGMRPAEVCIMRPSDIDRSGEIWIYRPESHKTEHHGRERIIPLGPKSQEILFNYLARDPQTYCFRPCDSEAKRRAELHAQRRTPLSSGNRPGTNRKRRPKRQVGEHYDTAAYRRAIHRACDKAFPHPELGYQMKQSFTAGQKETLRRWQSEHRWSPNQLRHAAATEIRRQFGLEAAQIILGHSQADVTQVYAERDLAKGLEVARQIG